MQYYKQREYDGKWELVQTFLDYENEYVVKDSVTNRVTLKIIPEKNITIKVYDYEVEIDNG